MKNRLIILLIIATTIFSSCTWQNGYVLYNNSSTISSMFGDFSSFATAIRDIKFYRNNIDEQELELKKLLEESGFNPLESISLVAFNNLTGEELSFLDNATENTRIGLKIQGNIYSEQKFTVPINLTLKASKAIIKTVDNNGLLEAYSLNNDGTHNTNIINSTPLEIKLTILIDFEIDNWDPEIGFKYKLNGNKITASHGLESKIKIKSIKIKNTTLETPLETTLGFKYFYDTNNGLYKFEVENLHVKFDTDFEFKEITEEQIGGSTISFPITTEIDIKKAFANILLPKDKIFSIINFKKLSAVQISDVSKLKATAVFKKNGKTLELNISGNRVQNAYIYDDNIEIPTEPGAENLYKTRVPLLSQIKLSNFPQIISSYVTKMTGNEELDDFLIRTLEAIRE